ncbi:bifunctional nuclease family protein [Hyperthermus butylicus]|uniref:Conserved crenarchaeal protein n=1 Tax=Hyperthermus butylicus (strain DSM 5456 / JCM 9403 / PLM1-5) TaxID=415426 RepID=A2BN39_HYPBU|nr:bifunctional nuclease domain-containing protein [Hyperthermus butylicus]ABM81400.1 conserved crenarchaeal protein [Hyperthermus butylicus DSM 5456]
MPPPRGSDVLLQARSINAMIMPSPPHIPVIVLELEDGREFTLYNVPFEIVQAINKLQHEELTTPGERETVFELLVDLRELVSELGKRLEYVVIDEIDYATALYTAKVSFILQEGIYMMRRMVPSHAVFLALLFNKPIYVSKRLVDEQEEYERMMREESEEQQE